ncbi:putative bifunctional diguanylate cyclase/phosphodiesterase [Tianweitania sp.]|uniref:putative bifunctional diguanylate cyclase/phosphodiesterase n=1 Tax=Tianweitania sp. TaxID=2021634 RepID=UPI002898F86E|nr:EAL domain-containing protein [Tianweitania sp.]
MTDKGSGPSADRLSTVIKCAYWFALMVMSAMTIASFVLLQQMMTEQQRDAGILQLSGEQKALSQRVVFLVLAASKGNGDNENLVYSLRSATALFEKNYDRLLALTGADFHSPNVQDPASVDAVFYGKPYHLDHFSTSLAANGWRLATAIEEGLEQEGQGATYLAGRERANVDRTVADATLNAYEALSTRLMEQAEQRRAQLMSMHRKLFMLSMATIAMIGLLVFRPMTQMIVRRTGQLVEARNEMAFAAEHDSLTGLYNRAYLIANFERFLSDMRARGERLAVIQIDLDRFKQINDTLGHAAGDMVLSRTAQRMRQACRAKDICVRLGGDEFIVLIPAPNSFTSVQSATTHLLDTINQPLTFNGATILPGASAGVAIFPDDASRSEDLIVHADLALYSAKRLGGGASAFFSGDLRAELDHHKAFARDIRIAVADDAFNVFFQPQVDLIGGSVIGVEALIRWRHPVRGTISPSIFLPVAEKSGAMADIGRLVIRKAIAQAGLWHRAGIVFGRLAVNVSSAELREPDFESFLFKALDQAGLPISCFSLEIVESVILDDEKTGIAHKLRRLRLAGIHLELDDFGTGYASLSHIDPDQIDRVKIDRRFVAGIDHHDANAKIVRAVIELARALEIGVVAEGAETQAQLEALKRLGCPAVQGYGIAFPMPGHETALWLTQQARMVAGLPPSSQVA